MNTSIEAYEIPQGRIIVLSSDKTLSTGLLQLLPGLALEKHNRPVPEQLIQAAGTATMTLFDERGSTRDVVLKEGSSLLIPANQYHIHANRADSPSITLWKFEGDITAVVQKIRESAKSK